MVYHGIAMWMTDALRQLTNESGDGPGVGTTKAEVKKLSGEDWDERAWNRMARRSRVFGLSCRELPLYDKKERKWYYI